MCTYCQAYKNEQIDEDEQTPHEQRERLQCSEYETGEKQ